MGMTMAEKVLARASGRDSVAAGTYVTAKADLAMSHEGFTLCAMQLMGIGVNKVFEYAGPGVAALSVPPAVLLTSTTPIIPSVRTLESSRIFPISSIPFLSDPSWSVLGEANVSGAIPFAVPL